MCNDTPFIQLFHSTEQIKLYNETAINSNKLTDMTHYFLHNYKTLIYNNNNNNKTFIDMKTIKKLKPARGRPAYSWPHIKSLIFTLKSLDLKHFIELVLKQMSGKMFHTGTTRLIK